MSSIFSPATPSDTPSELRAFAMKVLVLIAILAVGYTAFLLAPIVSILFFSGFLTLLFSPLLDRMRKYHIPDAIGILLIYFAILAFGILAFFAIVPIFVHQVSILFSELASAFSTFESAYRSDGLSGLGLPVWLSAYLPEIDLSTLFEYVRSHAAAIATTAAGTTKALATSSVGIIASISSGIFQTSMILVCTFLMSLERANIKRFLYRAFPTRLTEYLTSRETQIENILLSWLRGQLTLALSIFTLTLAGLLILWVCGIQIEGIVMLALIAGLMEFIPYIGPLLALLPALAIAAGMGFAPVVAILVLYIAIQQIENNILVPLVMSKTLDISPLLIFIVMLSGASLFGLAGVILAIPFAALLRMVVSDWLGPHESTSPKKQHPKKSK